MKLLIDRASLSRLSYTNQVNRRRYYVTTASDPRLAIVVCRNGLILQELSGSVVDALVGWDDGWPGFVPEPDVGRRHSKVTVYRRLNVKQTEAETTLSRLLDQAPRR